MTITLRAPERARGPWPALILGLAGILAALTLPFAPVYVATSTVTWPAPGEPVSSSTAMVVPYRPASLVAVVPCSALRAATERSTPDVLDTGDGGLLVTAGTDGAAVQLDDRRIPVPVPAGDCSTTIRSTPDGMAIDTADGRTIALPGARVPRVFGFRTALDPAAAAGLSTTITTVDRFTSTPGLVKGVLIAVALLAAVGSALLLPGGIKRRPRWRPRRAWWVDVGVVTTLGVWAMIGPLAVDDGWATMIARNVAATGNPGNYYRWWNAAEVPFAFSQELLAGLTTISVAPLWLRVPSTLLAVATWFVLSRGVLGAAMPVRSATVRVRLLAAVCLLGTWLPFNLGTRPESYVALGATVVLALAMRVRSPRGVGLLVGVAALTAPISPNGLLLAAPVVVFAPRLVAAVRAGHPSGLRLAARVTGLLCIAAVGVVIVFADQSWDALVTATSWHTFFGPALPWYEEPVRYGYLLQNDQQGSAAKRLAVLLTVAMLPIVGLLAARHRDFLGRQAGRLCVVVVVALALFALSPSKWSYHLGAAAGLFAALLTVSVVSIARRLQRPQTFDVIVGVAGTVLLTGAVAVSYAGPNAWWLPALYDVPWASEPIRVLGISATWIVCVAAALTVVPVARRTRPAAVAAPAVLVTIALGTSVAVLLGSFAAAPLRRPEGSLAMANLGRLSGDRVCGLADDVDVLPDGEVLDAADAADETAGFALGGGFPPAAPPPEPPGVGTAQFVWGSWSPDDTGAHALVSRWFVLPALAPDGGLAVSVAGRTDDGNHLSFEFGRAGGDTVLGARVPGDRPASDEEPAHPLWRSIGIDAAEVPAGADRVRLRAIDGRSDPSGWLAVTGPRLRSVIPLNRYLADHGPVLISWPQSFVFPCLLDVPTITAGVVQTPGAIIESPRPYSTEDRNRDLGGSFAGLSTFGDLHEVPTRLRGHPDVDWGTLRLPPDTPLTNGYLHTVTHVRVPGIGGVPDIPPER